MRPILLALAALVLATPWPAPLRAAARFVPDSSCTAKDFAVVKHDGLFHVFYIRNRPGVPSWQNQTDLGHAVSPDLYAWTHLPPVLPVRPGEWDRTHVWAPSIVEKDGVYHMFYTGVASGLGLELYQRIGVATSTDLVEWTRRDRPVFTCASVPWSFCDSTTENSAFRDAFVMADPARPGNWLMYYSVCPAIDTVAMVVGLAESQDLLNWSDRGALWATHHDHGTGNYIVESPHLFDHDGSWYLLYSSYASPPLQWLSTADPTGAPEAWTFHGGVTSLFPPGLPLSAYYASETFRDGTVDYLAYVAYGSIEFARIAWGAGGGPLALMPPDPMHVRSMAWDRAAAAEHDTAVVTFVTANPGPVPAALEAVRSLPDGSEVPVPLDSLGLPAAVALAADTTRLAWATRFVPDPRDTSRDMRLVLRLADRTASAAVLTVTPQPPLEVRSLAWDRGRLEYDEVATLTVAVRHGIRRSVPLRAFLVLDSGEVPVAPSVLGLPDEVWLAGDTTRVAWDAVWLSDPRTAQLLAGLGVSSVQAAPMRLSVRTADPAVVAPTITVTPPGPLRIRSLDWDRSVVAGDGFATLTLVADNGEDRIVSLQASRIVGGVALPVPPDSLELPGLVALAGDTTRLTWAAKWLADPADTLAPMLLTVRVAGSLSAPQLAVLRPEPLSVSAMAWDRDTVAHDSTATLAIVAEHWRRQAVALRAWRRLDGDVVVPVALDSLGLPGVVALTGDTTRLAWPATWLPAPPDTTSPLRLTLALADGARAAAELPVLPPAFEVTRVWWDSATVRVGNPATLCIASRHWPRRAARLEGWRLAAGGAREPLALAAVGLPAEVVLTADTTRVSWTSAFPGGVPPDTSGILLLEVRCLDPGPDPATIAVMGDGVRPAGVREGLTAREGLELRRDGDGWALAVRLERGAEARLDLYDTQGRHVRRLLERPLPAGVTLARWDGRDDRGATMPSGVYFARLATPRLRAGARLVRLR